MKILIKLCIITMSSSVTCLLILNLIGNIVLLDQYKELQIYFSDAQKYIIYVIFIQGILWLYLIGFSYLNAKKKIGNVKKSEKDK